jgi:two-component system, OmpR family, sensor histidine kinase PrrB
VADRRTRSLRARVAVAAALGTVVLAVVVAAVVAAVLTRREVTALDRRLDLVADVVAARVTAGEDPQELLGSPVRLALLRTSVGGLVVTIRTDIDTTTTGLDAPRPPELPPTEGTTSVGGRNYRVHTVALPDGGSVSVGLPTAATDQAVTRVRRSTVSVTALAVLTAAGLGWLLAGPAVRPLRELRDRTAALGGRPGSSGRAALSSGAVGRTTETAELAAALAGLLDRVDTAQAESERTLAAARDFASAAEHELRTPLTAMRTDLEVLTAHPGLPEAERQEILTQLAARQDRIEAALTALAQLATGDLGTGGRQAPVELTDLVARAAAAAAKTAPVGTEVATALPDGEITVPGSAPGLQLALDNLLANAVRHSGARRIEVSVHAYGDRVHVLVDDDGVGVPSEERVAVFARFRRGAAARTAGSGLGLALVAQQAALHGGRAYLTDSPLGGTRAVLDLPAR